jgi:hypothetical protein
MLSGLHRFAKKIPYIQILNTVQGWLSMYYVGFREGEKKGRFVGGKR